MFPGVAYAPKSEDAASRRIPAMNVTIAEPAQIVLRNSSDDDRRRVNAWIDYLEKWETDPYVRKHSKKLDEGGNVYMLLTSTDVCIFFSLEEGSITVLDVAKRATIVSSGRASAAEHR
jgi:hypothetical protein